MSDKAVPSNYKQIKKKNVHELYYISGKPGAAFSHIRRTGMTREEAINVMQKYTDTDSGISKVVAEAHEMAIKALEQEPTFDDECQKDMDEAWEQIQKKRKRIPVTLDLTPRDDAISREDALKCFEGFHQTETLAVGYVRSRIRQLPPVTPSRPTEHKSICDDCIYFADGKGSKKCDSCELTGTNKPSRHKGHCKDCKYFEYDSVAKVDGIPLIVAHEICSRWGNGCKTREDGYCFLFEPQESEEQTE